MFPIMKGNHILARLDELLPSIKVWKLFYFLFFCTENKSRSLLIQWDKPREWKHRVSRIQASRRFLSWEKFSLNRVKSKIEARLRSVQISRCAKIIRHLFPFITHELNNRNELGAREYSVMRWPWWSLIYSVVVLMLIWIIYIYNSRTP